MDIYSSFTISDSTKKEDYEILIKKRDTDDFISYCPQLNYLVKGQNFEEVYYGLDLLIIEHIKGINPDDETIIQVSLSDNLGIVSIDERFDFMKEKSTTQKRGENGEIITEDVPQSDEPFVSRRTKINKRGIKSESENEKTISSLDKELEHLDLEEVVSEEGVSVLKDDDVAVDKLDSGISEDFISKDEFGVRKVIASKKTSKDKISTEQDFDEEVDNAEVDEVTSVDGIASVGEVDGVIKKELKLNEDALKGEELDGSEEVIEQDGHKYVRKKLDIFSQYASQNL